MKSRQSITERVFYVRNSFLEYTIRKEILSITRAQVHTPQTNRKTTNTCQKSTHTRWFTQSIRLSLFLEFFKPDSRSRLSYLAKPIATKNPHGKTKQKYTRKPKRIVELIANWLWSRDITRNVSIIFSFYYWKNKVFLSNYNKHARYQNSRVNELWNKQDRNRKP